jgi:hypothetical protein
LAWGWPLARERIEFRGVTGLIQLAVNVDGLLTVVMGTTTITGVNFAVESEMIVMMELRARELECKGRPKRLSWEDVFTGFLDMEVGNEGTELVGSGTGLHMSDAELQ